MVQGSCANVFYSILVYLVERSLGRRTINWVLSVFRFEQFTSGTGKLCKCFLFYFGLLSRKKFGSKNNQLGSFRCRTGTIHEWNREAVQTFSILFWFT